MMKYISGILMLFFLTACAVTDDPRQGGLIGGIAGLSSGAYDRRIAERNNSLADLQNMQQNLQVDNAILQQQKRAQLSKVNRLKRQISDLDSEIYKLKKQLAKLKGNNRVSANVERKVGNIQNAIANQRRNLSQLNKTSNSSTEIAAIEANIRSLKQQLREVTEQALIVVQ